MKIRKLFFIMIALVGLCLSLLPHSFALSHQEVNSPLDKPDVGLVKDSNGWFLTFGYVFVNPNYNDGKPVLFLVDHAKMSSDTSINLTFGETSYTHFTNYFHYRWTLRGFTNKSQQYSTYLPYNLIDIETGNLLLTNNIVDSSNRVYLRWSLPMMQGGQFLDDGTGSYGYIIDSSEFYNVNISTGEDIYNISPFVNWGVSPPEEPEKHFYKSRLSEPEEDEYNSYFVVNNSLHWISYRVNALYSYSENIEVESQTFSQYGNSYQEDSSFSYYSNSSGNVEEFSGGGDVYGNTYDHATPQDSFIGVYNYDFDNINYHGDNNGYGTISNGNGRFYFNDTEVFPVSINKNLVNNFFRICIDIQDNKNFLIRVIPNTEQLNDLICDIDIYQSQFHLETGEYITSTYNHYQGAIYHYINIPYNFENSDTIIHDVYCYGCEFRNLNNIPVHLSSILWEYDVDFETWRNNMLSKLTDIYNLLSQSETLSSYQGKEFGSQLNANNALDDLSYNSNSVNSNINSLLGESINKLGSDGGVLRSLTANIIALGNGKIFSLLIISLAAGVIILLLGKNKND